MPRRRTNTNLPACVYRKHGAFYYVHKRKWTRLADNLHDALQAYARIVAQPEGGMAALIEEALPEICRGLAPSTVKQYERSARRLQTILAEFSPDQVEAVHVARIRRSLRDTPREANRAITVLRLVFEWALEEFRVTRNPCVGVKHIQTQARDRLIEGGEYLAIYEAAPERLQIMMDLCLLTGQRIGDVLAIKRADLRAEGIYFQQQKSKRGRPGTQLIVAWTPELRAAVERAKALTGNLAPMTLFYGKANKPPAYKIVWRQWRAACERAGVTNANIHDLRAMAGTEAARQGVDPTALLGHKDSRTTRIYLRDRSAKVVAGPRKKAAEK